MQNKTITPSLAGAVAALALALSGGAQAQTAGSWLVRAGATQISPQVTSGDLSPPSFTGTKVDVPLALPFKHDVIGAGAIAGVGKIG